MKAALFLAVLDESDVIFFGTLFLLTFVGIVVAFFMTMWIRRKSIGLSPYNGLPLRKCSDIRLESARKILQFLFDRQEYDNRIFSLRKAAFCRETGRIFTNCISIFGTIHVDWTFLQKRYPGKYVSWGGLTDYQRSMIQEAHDSLAGFQTQRSCPCLAPEDIEPEYVYIKPGPLYVDLDTKVLLGWQRVPGTEFEVLIAQKPKNK